MVETNRINMLLTNEEMEKMSIIKSRTGLTMNTEVVRYCINQLSKTNNSGLSDRLLKFYLKDIEDIDSPLPDTDYTKTS
jgi:hypothetical protein